MNEGVRGRLLRPFYRLCAPLLARHLLRRWRRDGLPQALLDPLEFLLTRRLSGADRPALARIESLRAGLAARPEACSGYASPEPGSVSPPEASGRPRPGTLVSMPAALIAERVSVDPYWGTFLHLCASAIGARTILELGSCAGVSGSYLASVRHCERFVTIEGSPELARWAQENIQRVAGRGEVVNALFDDALDRLLPTLGCSLDLAYLDGQHERLSTLHYVRRLLPHLHRGAVLILDDIRWTPDMWQAWQEIRGGAGLEASLDLGRFGLCIRGGPGMTPRSYDLSWWTRSWDWGRRRADRTGMPDAVRRAR